MAINLRNHQNSNGRNTIHCGLCRMPGHNRNSCPMVEPWAEEYAVHVAENDSEWGLTNAWRKCTAYNIRQKRLAKAENPRSKPACGFCRSTDHNRRNCKSMEQWRERLVKANIRWRKAYAEFAAQRGITPGSLVEVTHQDYNWQLLKYVSKTEVLLVDNTLPENLSLFCAADHWEVRQDHGVPLVGSVNNSLSGMPVNWLLTGPDCPFYKQASNLFSSCRYNQWTSGAVSPRVKVLKRSDYQFTDEWINQTPEDIDFVLKKLTEKRLKQYRLDTIIDKWQ
jgi:hypothetical protein